MDQDFNTAMAATEAFLASMRREWVKQYPGHECPVKTIQHYNGFNLGALMRSIQSAITTARSVQQGRA